MKKTILLALLTCAALHASDIKPQCARPIKPASFTENRDVRNYNDAVSRYKACMDDFIRKHRAIANKEVEAVNDAIAEWNSFATGTSSQTNKKRSNIKGRTGSTDGHHVVDHSDPTMLYKNLKF